MPIGWVWTKISNIAFVTKLAGFEYTKYVSPNLCENGIPLFKGKNIQNSEVVYEFESYIPLPISNELFRSQVNRKCILTPYVGTIGNIGVHDKEGIFHLGSNVGKIELFNEKSVVLEEYVVAYLKSKPGYIQLTKHMKATAQASISIEAIRDVIIPLPPSNEQTKICKNIESLNKLIEQIESNQDGINETIILLKSKILDLAIRGKLVPQDPEDEPASVLLERIRAEKEELIKQGKIKRDKNESVIFKGDDNSYYEKIGDNVVCVDDELPYDIPDNWVYIRLKSVLDYEQPTPYIVESTAYSNDYDTPVLTAGKSFIIGYTNETNGIKDNLPVIIFDDFTTESKFVNFPFKVKSSAMKILTADERIISTIYAFYAMQKVECDSENHKRYWISEFSDKIIGLPPLNEQHRIVSKIKKIESLFE